MKIYAYCRVSTEQQNLDRQEEAIKEYVKENSLSIDKWYCDKISGKTFDRASYIEMKEAVTKDDIIIIKELDRFGRSMEAIKQEWRYFMDAGVRIIVIDMPLISSDISGKKTLDMQFISNLVFEVLCYSAEKEREKISQRTKEGLASRKAVGVKLGRPAKNESNYDYIIKNYGKKKVKEIAKELNIPLQSLFLIIRRLKAEGKITVEVKRRSGTVKESND